MVLAAIGLVVIIHELGHALAALCFKLTISDISLGMGPSLWNRSLGSVRFHLGMIPFGGFVRVVELLPESDFYDHPETSAKEIPGNNPQAEDKAEYKKFRFSVGSTVARLLTITAGSLANILFAGLLIFLSAWCWGAPTGTLSGLEVTTDKVSPTNEFYLQSGDLLTHIDEQPIIRAKDYSRIMRGISGDVVILRVLRDGIPVELRVKPVRKKKKIGLGVGLIKIPRRKSVSFWSAAYRGFFDPWEQALGQLKNGIQMIRPETQVKPVSVVGIADRVSRSRRWNGPRIFRFGAMLSIAVGLFNLIPFPGLDGGRLIIELGEVIRKRRLNPRQVIGIQVVGLLILLLAWLLIAGADLFYFIEKF